MLLFRCLWFSGLATLYWMTSWWQALALGEAHFSFAYIICLRVRPHDI